MGSFSSVSNHGRRYIRVEVFCRKSSGNKNSLLKSTVTAARPPRAPPVVPSTAHAFTREVPASRTQRPPPGLHSPPPPYGPRSQPGGTALRPRSHPAQGSAQEGSVHWSCSQETKGQRLHAGAQPALSASVLPCPRLPSAARLRLAACSLRSSVLPQLPVAAGHTLGKLLPRVAQNPRAMEGKSALRP